MPEETRTTRWVIDGAELVEVVEVVTWVESHSLEYPDGDRATFPYGTCYDSKKEAISFLKARLSKRIDQKESNIAECENTIQCARIAIAEYKAKLAELEVVNELS